jgi:hypothetical protein
MVSSKVVSLDDLRAYETDFAIFFDCPCRGGHRIRILKADTRWLITGTFPKITVRPCMETPCWHGLIDAGEVTSYKHGEVHAA